VAPASGLPYHHWLIEFAEPPGNPEAFGMNLDAEMTRQNIYYRDLIQGHVLRPLVITQLQPGTFHAYMKSVGRLGGQNKVQRLANDHSVADALIQCAHQ
ncbi:MAG: GH3 auxin-responsive promoter family protein, partial [Bacteroidota bacterium]